MGASLRFEKYEGLGNDFILVDVPDEAEVTPERAGGRQGRCAWRPTRASARASSTATAW
jgi:hypothetical protein